MRRFLVVLMVGAAACSSPTRPTVQEPPPPLLHHNVPATTDDGRLVWLCSTQPREYVTPGGQVYLERDHYISATECPVTPIE